MVNKLEDFIKSSKPTTREFILALREKDTDFWANIFKDEKILKQITQPEVFEHMPVQAGQKFQDLIVNLRREPKSKVWKANDEYLKELDEEKAEDEYKFKGSRGYKLVRTRKTLRHAIEYALESHLWKKMDAKQQEELIRLSLIELNHSKYHALKYTLDPIDFITDIGEMIAETYNLMVGGKGKSVLRKNPNYSEEEWSKQDKLYSLEDADNLNKTELYDSVSDSGSEDGTGEDEESIESAEGALGGGDENATGEAEESIESAEGALGDGDENGDTISQSKMKLKAMHSTSIEPTVVHAQTRNKPIKPIADIIESSMTPKSSSIGPSLKRKEVSIDLTEIDDHNELASTKEQERLRGLEIDLPIHARLASYRSKLYKKDAVEKDAQFLSKLNTKFDDMKIISSVKKALLQYQEITKTRDTQKMSENLQRLKDGSIDEAIFNRLLSISGETFMGEGEKTWGEIKTYLSAYRLYELVEDAAYPEVSNGDRGKGNPLMEMKSAFYRNYAKMECIRDGNSLESTEDKAKLSKYIKNAMRQKRLGSKLRIFVDHYGIGIIMIFPFVLESLYEAGESRNAFKYWNGTKIIVLCQMLEVSRCSYARTLQSLCPLLSRHMIKYPEEALDVDAILKEIEDKKIQEKETTPLPRYTAPAASVESLQDISEGWPSKLDVRFTSSISISIADLGRLVEGEWVNNYLVDGILHAYRHLNPDDLYLVTSNELNVWNSMDEDKQKRKTSMLRKEVTKFNKFLCVLHFSSHWTCQVAEVDETSAPTRVLVRNWNSMGSPVNCRELEKWVCSMFQRENEPDPVIHRKRESSIIQKNSDDCGVIAVHNALNYYTNEIDNAMTTDSFVQEARERFARAIVAEARKISIAGVSTKRQRYN